MGASPRGEVRSELGIWKKIIEPEREEQADSRLRTYFTLFRGLGLLYDEDGTIRVTPEARIACDRDLDRASETVGR